MATQKKSLDNLVFAIVQYLAEQHASIDGSAHGNELLQNIRDAAEEYDKELNQTTTDNIPA